MPFADNSCRFTECKPFDTFAALACPVYIFYLPDKVKQTSCSVRITIQDMLRSVMIRVLLLS